MTVSNKRAYIHIISNVWLAIAGVQALPVCIDMFKRRLDDRSSRSKPKLTLIVITGTTRVESREDLKAICAEVEVGAHSKERESLSLSLYIYMRA